MRKTRSKSPAPRTRAAKATTSAAVRGNIPRNKPAHAVAKLRFSIFSLGRLRRWLLCELAGKVFAEVDTNGDGRLDAAELYAGVLLVYMHVAAYVYIRPPSRQAVLAELAERITMQREGTDEWEGFHTVLSMLSYMLKAPLVPPGTPVINALFQQRQCLVNVFRACVGLAPENQMLLEHKFGPVMRAAEPKEGGSGAATTAAADAPAADGQMAA